MAALGTAYTSRNLPPVPNVSNGEGSGLHTWTYASWGSIGYGIASTESFHLPPVPNVSNGEGSGLYTWTYVGSGGGLVPTTGQLWPRGNS